jgi:hypothetical protein
MIKLLDMISGIYIDTKKKTVNAKYGYATNFNSRLIKKVNRAFSLCKYFFYCLIGYELSLLYNPTNSFQLLSSSSIIELSKLPAPLF